jgi:hypothetical protein
MQPESQAFTADDMPGFTRELVLVEAEAIIRRIRQADARLRELAASVPETEPAGDSQWNAKEVLAHIAVFSRGWGALGYLVASGRVQELKVADVINQRDTLGEEMVRKPVAEILQEIEAQHGKTIAFLERATVDQLLRSYKHEWGESTAEQIFRLPVTAHLEQHLDQLERALAREGAVTAKPVQ